MQHQTFKSRPWKKYIEMCTKYGANMFASNTELLLSDFVIHFLIERGIGPT